MTRSQAHTEALRRSSSRALSAAQTTTAGVEREMGASTEERVCQGRRPEVLSAVRLAIISP